MDIKIKKGSFAYLDDCEDILLNSELGKKYFTSAGSGRNTILEGLEQECLYIALINNVCIGFIWYIPNGVFHSFPYVHIICVKEEYRCKGIGKNLMTFIEKIVFGTTNKIFLVVADFNPDAKRFYE